MKSAPPSFWVTNISNRNVSLADLALTIKAFCTVNLLDKKHYQYTIDQLEKSKINGSISAKRDKIVCRENAPKVEKISIPIQKEDIIPSRERSVYSIKEEYYEELNVTDDEYINASEEETPKSKKE